MQARIRQSVIHNSPIHSYKFFRQGSFILLKADKIFIFATFLSVFFWSLKSSAAEKSLIQIDNYAVIFRPADSILVADLFSRMQKPLERIEDFFRRKPGSVITIVITRSGEEYLRHIPAATPQWSQAIARPEERLIVLKLSDAHEIKNAPFILAHELVHIYLGEYFLQKRLPAWLNEGLAEYLSDSGIALEQKVLLANALSARKIVELNALDSLLTFPQAKAHLAYAEALSAVEFFTAKHGSDRLLELIQNITALRSVNMAFKSTVGYDFIDFEILWYEDLTKKYRWLIILNLDNLLWVLMGLLAVAAILVVKSRNRKKLKTWEENELKLKKQSTKKYIPLINGEIELYIPQKIFLTKGVGKHRERLASFEMALRDAGIGPFNLVGVSSIYPAGCALVDREVGLKEMTPGQIVHAVYSRNETNEPGRLISASVGLAVPKDETAYGYLSEHHGFGQTEQQAGDYAEDLAAEMLATVLGVEFDADLSWDEKRNIWKISDKIVHTQNITIGATGDERGLWTTVISAAILLP